MILWFYATIHIPIAEVTAIGYSIPLYVTIRAASFFGEHLKQYHLLALGFGFTRATLIIGPGFQEVSLRQMTQLLASPMFAASYLIAKRISLSESSMVIVGMLSLSVSIAQMPIVLAIWETPNFFEVICLGLVAILATTGHYAMTQSFRLMPMKISQPVTYLQLVWTSIIGIYLFGDRLDIFVVLGGTMITLYVAVIAYLNTRTQKA